MGLLILALYLIVALAAMGIAIAAYYAWRSISQPNQPGQSYQKSSGAKSHNPNAVSKEVRSRLLNMVAGDQATACRLVDHVRASNPGQTESWCWEKAIEDLLRDRL